MQIVVNDATENEALLGDISYNLVIAGRNVG
jgi:hypothetical protein